MKQLLSSFYNKILNYPLHFKLALITAFAVILTSLASVFGMQILLSSYNNLLYQAIAGSLNYSAEDISSKLANIEAMTNAIVSNPYIRKSLISYQASPYSPIVRNNTENTVTSSLIDYYQNYKSNDIRYINLCSGFLNCTSFNSELSVIPEDISHTILEKTKQNSGYSTWTTDYCNTYGLFLSRDCRRVRDLKLETLGTVIVNIDLGRLISSSTKNILQDGQGVAYVLYNDQNMIYHSPELSEEMLSDISPELSGNFDFMTLNRTRYFYTHGSLAHNNWTYLCLVPYSHIDRTIAFILFLSFLVLLSTIGFIIFFLKKMIAFITSDFQLLIRKMKQFSQDESFVPEHTEAYRSRIDEAGMLHRQFDDMVFEIQHLIEENYIHEILTKDANQKFLESQINPHFLYNALESINWRAKAIGADDISAMVKSLGDLLRISLSDHNTNFTVARELTIVHDYMLIQKSRFDEGRLSYTEDVDPKILSAELPKLSLQPLIDNAVSYGMDTITENCHIHLSGKIRKGVIHISVLNNGSQFEADLLLKLAQGSIKPHGVGIGLLNIEQRLQLLYGKEYGLVLSNPDEDHALAEIVIPFFEKD